MDIGAVLCLPRDWHLVARIGWFRKAAIGSVAEPPAGRDVRGKVSGSIPDRRKVLKSS